MNSSWIIAVAIAVPVISFLALTKWFLRRLQRQSAEALINRVGKENILSICSNANFFGQKSKGMKQVRGNGTWILTREQILFSPWVGKNKIEIPLFKVRGTGTAKSFLGKSVAMTLMTVHFENGAGQNDEIAWLISDLENRRAMIDQLIKKV